MNFAYKVTKLFRIKEWYDSKVPMLILPALYTAILNAADSTAQIITVITLILFNSVFLAFGYLINDVADWEVDQKAGKKKIIHQMSKKTAISITCMTAAAGVVLILAVSHNWITVFTLSIIYFFGASYSAPPFRFKEKGVWGLIVSSAAQRCFPMLLIPVLTDTNPDFYFWLWFLLSFIVGLRYILVHQYLDAENDRKAGVHTFAESHMNVIAVMIQICFLLELIMLVILMQPLVKLNFAITAVLVVYALISFIRAKGSKAVFGQCGLYSFDQVPLEDFYNLILPLILICILMVTDLKWGILLIVWLVILLRPTMEHLKFPAKILWDRVHS